MTDNIPKLIPKDAAKDPDFVLEKAIGNFGTVLIIGWDKEGYLDVRSNIGLEHRDTLWLIETFRHKLLNGDFFDDD